MNASSTVELVVLSGFVLAAPDKWVAGFGSCGGVSNERSTAPQTGHGTAASGSSP